MNALVQKPVFVNGALQGFTAASKSELKCKLAGMKMRIVSDEAVVEGPDGFHIRSINRERPLLGPRDQERAPGALL